MHFPPRIEAFFLFENTQTALFVEFGLLQSNYFIYPLLYSATKSQSKFC